VGPNRHARGPAFAFASRSASSRSQRVTGFFSARAAWSIAFRSARLNLSCKTWSRGIGGECNDITSVSQERGFPLVDGRNSRKKAAAFTDGGPQHRADRRDEREQREQQQRRAEAKATSG